MPPDWNWNLHDALQTRAVDFLRSAQTHDWVTASVAYATQHGPYRAQVPGMEGHAHVEFSEKGAVWYFVSKIRGEDYVLELDAPKRCRMEIYQGNLDAATEMRRLTTDDALYVQEVNKAELSDIVSTFTGLIEKCEQECLGIVHQDAAPSTPEKGQPMWVLWALLAVFAVCGGGCGVNILLMNLLDN